MRARAVPALITAQPRSSTCEQEPQALSPNPGAFAIKGELLFLFFLGCIAGSKKQLLLSITFQVAALCLCCSLRAAALTLAVLQESTSPKLSSLFQTSICCDLLQGTPSPMSPPKFPFWKCCSSAEMGRRKVQASWLWQTRLWWSLLSFFS